jgi:probable phosphoglycerate mutase
VTSSIFLIRHGETSWSLSGRHTGRTDLPLNADGERAARALAPRLRAAAPRRVLSSPRLRARQTCALAGVGEPEIEPDLAEWDYGDYEGLTSAEILGRRPGWSIFRDGCPGGESPEQVSRRADRLIARLRGLEERVAVFTHGHFGRALAARWIELPVADGRLLCLSTASLSLLSFERENPAAPVIALWNETVGGAA